MEMMPGYSPEYVTAIFDLYGGYRFNEDEIALIRQDETIISILAKRISRILEDEKNPPSSEILENNLKENKSEVIRILEEYKEELSGDKYTIEKINETIDMIEKLEEIKNKYEGKFSKTKRYINGEPIVDIETYNKAVKRFNDTNRWKNIIISIKNKLISIKK